MGQRDRLHQIEAESRPGVLRLASARLNRSKATDLNSSEKPVPESRTTTRRRGSSYVASRVTSPSPWRMALRSRLATAIVSHCRLTPTTTSGAWTST